MMVLDIQSNLPSYELPNMFYNIFDIFVYIWDTLRYVDYDEVIEIGRIEWIESNIVCVECSKCIQDSH